ncbi:MAG: hypothetical protein AAFO83_00205 [Cyanobacteria bacterium J06607_13]
MTIHLGCNQCGGSGVVSVYKVRRTDFPLARMLNPDDPATAPIILAETIEEYCECEAGHQRRLYDNQMSHPKYCNPFKGMSDAEILDAIAEATKDRNAIEQEFNL